MFRKLAVVTSFCLLGVFGAANMAHAHLVAFGWKDNGNGTVTMWGQHWHGDLGAPDTANGGLRIGVWGTDPSTWQVFQWTGFVNNIGGDTTQNNAMVSGGTLTGWATAGATWGDYSGYNDWMTTDPLVIGNGTWGFYTGPNCCIDEMDSGPVQFTLTGITSVNEGTGPAAVPEPATLTLVGLGGLAAVRRRLKRKK